MTEEHIRDFQETVWDYYRQFGRGDLPWRQLKADGSIDPYKVLVSELMLQQTQVLRVIPKFHAFIDSFPTTAILAAAPLSEVLTAWSGLGYNRRAKFLWMAAQAICDRHHGHVPSTPQALVALPGVGPNTAGAILAYAFNQPVAYIETNIRTIYIHHFFADHTDVADKDLLPLIAASVPSDEARDWYWALMDYGSFLKQTVGNAARMSKTYIKQSAFEGSRRQVRGSVLRELIAGPRSLNELQLVQPDERLQSVLQDLLREGLIQQSAGNYRLAA